VSEAGQAWKVAWAANRSRREQQEKRIAELEAECNQWQKKLTDDAWPEIERLRSLVKELQDLTIDQQMEIERLRDALAVSAGGTVDWIVRAEELQAEVERLGGFVAEMQPELGKLKTENERLRAALTEIMQGARSVDYAIHVARVALGHP
jgi:chromosome segregation ATPase